MEVEQLVERMRELAVSSEPYARHTLANLAASPSVQTLARVVQCIEWGAVDSAREILRGVPVRAATEILLAETWLDVEIVGVLADREVYTVGEAAAKSPDRLVRWGLDNSQIMELRLVCRRCLAVSMRQESQKGRGGRRPRGRSVQEE